MTRLMDGLRFFTGKPAILAFFILCALPVGVMSALVTPPGQAPDEREHAARAASLLHWGILGERRAYPDPNTGQMALWAGLKVDEGLFDAAGTALPSIAGRPVMTTPAFEAIRAQPPDHRKIIPNLQNTAAYFPSAYVPAALGMALGLAVHAPPYACFLLGRVFNLAGFLLLGGLALGITAYGEAVLLIVLIMPMTLFLAGSITQDSGLIGLACLACAALTRATRGFRILGLAAFVLMLGGKPPYILMLGAFLLPFLGGGFWLRLRQVAVASVPVLIWVALILAFVVVPFHKPMFHPGPLYPGNPNIWMDHSDARENLHILLSPPTRLISLPWRTVLFCGPQRVRQIVGVLGLLQIYLPDYIYLAWALCGVVALLGLVFTRRPVELSNANKILNFLFVLFLMAATCWVLMIQFYLDWTTIGLDWIDGIQGRYFLPLLPFLLFAIPGFRWRFALPPLLPALPAIALGIFDIGYIPMKLVWGFYLH
jgi:uncharacterized membrane protein